MVLNSSGSDENALPETGSALEGEQAETLPSDEVEMVSEETPAETPESDHVSTDAADSSEPASADAPASEAATTQEQPSAFKRGDIVEATITETSSVSIKVDLDGKAVGTIRSSELDRVNKRDLENLQVGKKILVYVVNPRGQDGSAVVSINLAAEERDWKLAQEYRQNQQAYDTRISGYNRGGLIVKFGRLRGFVPQSQMNAERRRATDDETPEQRWGKMVNEPIVVKVMEVDRERNRLILSERMASKESREKRKENLITRLQQGEERTGRVVSLEDFGAFIDIGGAEGLVHLTELSWQHVNHPREVLKVGEEVRVRVISIDSDAKRIGLSIKQLAADPWDIVATTYSPGHLVQGTVTKLTKFGAFAQIFELPEIEGLIHISELSDRRVNHPKEVVNEGDKLTMRIVKIDIKNRRLGLSLKRVNSAEYLDIDWWETDKFPSDDSEATAPEAESSGQAALDTNADEESSSQETDSPSEA
ncbi:MAG: S1 RNA-binding domain-containing protein [Anaerolineae bacterium]|nr:S1 RNA-binding domain-containing protein [Anaerolineae bacterium]